jgi:tetratricopeptide (TPR) repeat protein
LSVQDLTDFGGTERFHIRRRIGAGGMGVVYEAFDRDRGHPVALKTLQRADAAAIYRLKREFEALHDVAHPNLVVPYEVVSAADQWFLTMELVDGVDFISHVRENAESSGAETLSSPPPDAVVTEITPGRGAAVTPPPPAPAHLPPLNLDRLRAALRQLAEGVCTLHDAGKLHRDIKPSNVLVAEKGRVALLDFGLVGDQAPDPGQTTTEGTVGTPAYMSPEQAAGHSATPASDWYAVGVMLYEALTGRLPFTGSALHILSAKQLEDPKPPSAIVSGAPDDLNDLCMELVRRRPGSRPAGREVLRRLGGAAVRELPAPENARRTAAAPFAGRGRHLAALGDAFAASRTGRPVLVYAHGRSGFGTTALVHHFLDDLRERREAIVLAGRCYERASVPYKAVDPLIDALSRHLMHLPRAEAVELMPRYIQALARLFPVLRRVEAVAAAPRVVLAPDPQELRRHAFGALKELLARIGDRRPLVLYIDDLQWGDLDSGALVAELLRPPDVPAMLLVAGYRSEDAESSPVLGALRGPEALPGADVRELQVGALAPDEAREIALALLGRDDAAARARAEAIAGESEGSPFFVVELVRYLKAAEAQGDAGAAVVTLEQALEARLAPLTEPSRRVLEAIAASGRPLAQGVAMHAAGLASEERVALESLRTRHLIRTRGARDVDAVELYHDRIRQAVLARLEPARLQALHRHLADALEAAALVEAREARGRADPEVIAEHLLAAGDRTRAGEYAARAAAEAAEALAFDRAARLYRLALELRSGPGSEDGSARELQTRLGDALANAGRGAEAAEVYLRAGEDAPAAQALELRRRAGEQYLRAGHVDEGLEVLRAVLAAIGMRLARTPQRALASMLFRRARSALRGIRYTERAAAGPGEDFSRIDACWSVAMGLSMVDTIRGADYQARHLVLALDAGEPYRVARALATEVGYAALTGGRARKKTERLLRTAAEIAARIDHPHALGLAKLAAGLASFCFGQWREARDAFERAEAVLRERCTGVAWEINTAQYMRNLALLYCGGWGELFRRGPILSEEAQQRGNLYAVYSLRLTYGVLAGLAADDVEAARKEVREASARWSRQGFQLQHYWALLAETFTDLYTGDGHAARERIAAGWFQMKRSLLLRIQVIRGQMRFMRAFAALAAAAQSGPATVAGRSLLRSAERAARRIAGENAAWCQPMALLVRAGVAAARGHANAAVAILDEAARAFDGAEMAMWAAAARRQRGDLVGGEEGLALVRAADAFMSGEGIKNPARIAAMLAPGFGQPA